MPNTRIREIDSTVGATFNSSSNIVYIPGLAGDLSDILKTNAEYKVPSIPTLVSTTSEFRGIFGKPSETLTNKGYIMAYELLKLGLQVLYHVPTDKSTQLAVVDEEALQDWIEEASNWSFLSDKGRFDMRFVSFGGYTPSSAASIILNVMGTEPTLNNTETVGEQELQCLKRKDCTFLVDIPKEQQTQVTEALDYLKGLNISEELDKYCAVFSPNCVFTVDSEFIAFKDEGYEVELPASFAYLNAYANSIRTYNEWEAVAGAKRGTMSGLVAPIVEYSEEDVYNLQKRRVANAGLDSPYAINPIVNIRPYGYLIWGNRTMQKLEATTDLTASSFLNIRQLVSTIKKQLFIACQSIRFDLNTDVTWTNFKSLIIPTLDRMVTGNGLRGYKIIREETQARATLKARIKILAVESLEDMDLTVELTDNLDVVQE